MSDIPLGFERQPKREGSCGAFALGHALNLVGITGGIENFKNLANYISWSRSADKNFSFSGLLKPISTINKISKDIGTTEKGIPRGIKKSGCIPIEIDNYSKSSSRKILDSNLKKGFPVILFANWDKDEEDGGHWYVCAGREDSKYIMIDSKPKLKSKKIISLYTWDEITRRSMVYGEGDYYFQLYGFAVQPPDGVSAVPQLHKYLNQLYRDQILKEYWGYYIRDLRKIFDTTGNVKNVITASEFFSRFGKSFLEFTKDWNYELSTFGIKKKLRNYQIVADAYNLAISKPRLDEVLIGFTAALVCAPYVD